MKQKKFYAIRREYSGVWKIELNANEIVKISHYGAGDEMCNDSLTIELSTGACIEVDEIVTE